MENSTDNVPVISIRFEDGRNATYEFHNCATLTPGIFEKALDRLMDALMQHRNMLRLSEKQAERQREFDAGKEIDAEVNAAIDSLKAAEAVQTDANTANANETMN